jgi:hypothetical protein
VFDVLQAVLFFGGSVLGVSDFIDRCLQANRVEVEGAKRKPLRQLWQVLEVLRCICHVTQQLMYGMRR